MIGYGLLARATLDLFDTPSSRGLRHGPLGACSESLSAPWLSAFLWAGLFIASNAASRRLNLVLSPSWNQRLTIQTYPRLSTSSLWIIGASAAYGWLFWFWLAHRCARRRLGRFWPTLRRSLLTALGFVGSLIAGFWTTIELWRDYFFDPRLARVLFLASFSLTLVSLSGCGTPALGDVRRRDLFSAMPASWVLGPALFRRWRNPGNMGRGSYCAMSVFLLRAPFFLRIGFRMATGRAAPCFAVYSSCHQSGSFLH